MAAGLRATTDIGGGLGWWFCDSLPLQKGNRHWTSYAVYHDHGVPRVPETWVGSQSEERKDWDPDHSKKSRMQTGQAVFGTDPAILHILQVPESLAEVRLMPQYRHLGARIHVGHPSGLPKSSSEFEQESLLVQEPGDVNLWIQYWYFGPASCWWISLLPQENLQFLSGIGKSWDPGVGTTSLEPGPGKGLCPASKPAREFTWSTTTVFTIPLCQCTRRSTDLGWVRAKVGRSTFRGILLAIATLRGYGPDSNGHDRRPDLHEWSSTAGATLRPWIRKAEAVAQLNHARRTEWGEWRYEILMDMIKGGLDTITPWPATTEQDPSMTEACLACNRTFLCKAAWSAHAFKAHGRLNRARGLVGGSRCDACEKEYYTSTKLQAHLCYSRRCYNQLVTAGKIYDVVLPGKNNTKEQQAPTFQVPPVRSEGPKEQRLNNDGAEMEQYDWDLMEAIIDHLLALRSDSTIQECVQAIKEALMTSTNRFGDTRRTLNFFSRTTAEENADMEWQVPHSRVCVAAELAVRRCTLNWFFDANEMVKDKRSDVIRNAAAAAFAISAHVPAALKMCWDDQRKEYATASLKTYPAALCHGLADLARLWMHKRASFSTGVAEGPMRDFVQFTEDLSRGFNQEVGRGADLYIPVVS